MNQELRYGKMKLENLQIFSKDYSNLFISDITEKELGEVKSFLRDLGRSGIHLRNVRVIKERKTGLGSYDSSAIFLFDKKSEERMNYNGLGRFIGRTFDLSFGSGVLEFDRSRRDFDFSFSYTAKNRIEEEILSRLDLDNVSYGVHRVSYGVRVYPANVNKVKASYEEVKFVDRNLKIAPKISRVINSILKR